jgi:hypothetical protein
MHAYAFPNVQFSMWTVSYFDLLISVSRRMLQFSALYIQEVPVSNLGMGTGYPNKIFVGCPQMA